MGTLLAFMMAVVALSLPELILLRRVLKPPLILTFVGVTAPGSSPWDTCSTLSSRSETPVPISLSKEATVMIIKILGPGCANCVNLERVTREAVADLGIDAEFEKVTDYPAIMGYGVMSTPGLVVDEKVVMSGRVPTLPRCASCWSH